MTHLLFLIVYVNKMSYAMLEIFYNYNILTLKNDKFNTVTS
jgi:hypothetical protein